MCVLTMSPVCIVWPRFIKYHVPRSVFPVASAALHNAGNAGGFSWSSCHYNFLLRTNPDLRECHTLAQNTKELHFLHRHAFKAFVCIFFFSVSSTLSRANLLWTDYCDLRRTVLLCVSPCSPSFLLHTHTPCPSIQTRQPQHIPAGCNPLTDSKWTFSKLREDQCESALSLPLSISLHRHKTSVSRIQFAFCVSCWRIFITVSSSGCSVSLKAVWSTRTMCRHVCSRLGCLFTGLPLALWCCISNTVHIFICSCLLFLLYKYLCYLKLEGILEWISETIWCRFFVSNGSLDIWTVRKNRQLIFKGFLVNCVSENNKSSLRSA